MPANQKFYSKKGTVVGHFLREKGFSFGSALLEFKWKMKRKNYIFTNKKHSQRAIMSTILGIISLVSLTAVVYLTYLAGGEAQNGYGVTGLLATIFSFIGLILGIVTLRDKTYFRLFPWLGVIFNLLALGGICLILYLGSIL